MNYFRVYYNFKHDPKKRAMNQSDRVKIERTDPHSSRRNLSNQKGPARSQTCALYFVAGQPDCFISAADAAGNALVHHWGCDDYQLKRLDAAFLLNFHKPTSRSESDEAPFSPLISIKICCSVTLNIGSQH